MHTVSGVTLILLTGWSALGSTATAADAPSGPTPVNAPAAVTAPATVTAPTTVTSPATFAEGAQYERLSTPLPAAPAGRVTVTEFFSYGCIHCFHFEPVVDAWRKAHRADVDLVLVPATFRADFAMLARGFYASQLLGVAQTVHSGVFDAIWNKKRPAGNVQQMADLYADLGVDRGKFIDACASPEVEEKLKAAAETMVLARVGGTPDLIVAGKYRVLLSGLAKATDAFKVVDYLISLELPTPKPRPAPHTVRPRRRPLAAGL